MAIRFQDAYEIMWTNKCIGSSQPPINWTLEDFRNISMEQRLWGHWGHRQGKRIIDAELGSEMTCVMCALMAGVDV
ncbi:hypothetical protein RRG08_062194 [Elysia crispata]|uniref:Uncharacterized protein n=1 Tax=Elysia crispata TaxID=231223 RepID=A0AAE0YAA4_9GAST|nr:hypothetical protein RRG08_062194 [Elysia crispata]